tara:strand:+ start:229 stop:915 length:687 start_codon:yes stop_codon:yes gene_type:complete
MTRRIRQQDILPEETLLGRSVHVVGCGAIGSFVALSVGKMAGPDVNLFLYDDDEVSEENLAVQFYRTSDIGRNKAEALAEIIQAFDGPVPIVEARRIGKDDCLGGIVLACTDTISSRADIFDAAYRGGARVLVDGRMGAEFIKVLSCDFDNEDEVAFYRKSLMGSPYREPCTAKAIIYTVNLAAGIVVSTLKQWLTGVDRPAEFTLDARHLYPNVLDPIAPQGAEEAA